MTEKIHINMLQGLAAPSSSERSSFHSMQNEQSNLRILGEMYQCSGQASMMTSNRLPVADSSCIDNSLDATFFSHHGNVAQVPFDPSDSVFHNRYGINPQSVSKLKNPQVIVKSFDIHDNITPVKVVSSKLTEEKRTTLDLRDTSNAQMKVTLDHTGSYMKEEKIPERKSTSRAADLFFINSCSDVSFRQNEMSIDAHAHSVQPDSTNNLPDSRCVSSSLDHREAESSQLCQVCGDKAAGFYCGAYICEACKKFFMRACKQDKTKYICLRDRTCVITKESRVQCQYCRYQKCLKLNMYCPGNGPEKSSEKVISEIPCRVCNAPSSGFHFGALTCEGCKGFFRRMAKEREPTKYRCNKDNDCQISAVTRNICKACRYRKCLSIGMSVQGSRIGRQPNSVKHAISLELEIRGKQNPENRVDLKEMEFEEVTSIEENPNDSDSVIQVIGNIKEEPISPPEVESPMTTVNLNACTRQPSPSQTLILDLLMQADEILRSLNKENPSGCCFSSRNHQHIWDTMMVFFQENVEKVIKFCKKVYGFSSLPVSLKISLIQSAMYPLVLANLSRSTTSERMVNYFNFSRVEADIVLAEFPMLKTLEKHFRHIGEIFYYMNVSDMEITFLSVFLLLRADLPDECHNKQLEDLQMCFMELLEDYLEEKYPLDKYKRIGALMIRLGELRLCSVQHDYAIDEFLRQNPDLKMSELYNEIFATITSGTSNS